MPNFLIVGAAKSGTTSLHYYLQQHPEIHMSRRKDTFFFNFYGEEPSFNGPGDNEWYKRHAIIRREDYQAQFEGARGETAIGEACAQYLYDPRVPVRLHRDIPNARLIAILRNPVDRAYSSFLQQVRDGYETRSDFGEALNLEEYRIRNNWRPIWHYRKRGFYHQQLQKYLLFFDSSRIRVYLYEDLKDNTSWMLSDIFQHLGVDDSFAPDTTVRHKVQESAKTNLSIAYFGATSATLKYSPYFAGSTWIKGRPLDLSPRNTQACKVNIDGALPKLDGKFSLCHVDSREQLLLATDHLERVRSTIVRNRMYCCSAPIWVYSLVC